MDITVTLRDNAGYTFARVNIAKAVTFEALVFSPSDRNPTAHLAWYDVAGVAKKLVRKAGEKTIDIVTCPNEVADAIDQAVAKASESHPVLSKQTGSAPATQTQSPVSEKPASEKPAKGEKANKAF